MSAFKLHYLLINILMILMLTALVFAVAIWWLAWPIVVLGSLILFLSILYGEWNNTYTIVPDDTVYVYNNILGTRVGIKPYVYAWPGKNYLLLWFLVKEDEVDLKKDIIIEKPFTATTSDGGKVEGNATLGLKIDEGNIRQWIRSGRTEAIRVEVVQRNFGNFLGELASSLVRGFTRDLLIKGSAPDEHGNVQTGIQLFKLRMRQYFEAEKEDFECSYGVQVETLSVGNLKADAETEKSMQQVLVNRDLTAAAIHIVEEGRLRGQTIPLMEAMEIVLVTSDETEAHQFRISGDADVAAALAAGLAMMRGGGPPIGGNTPPQGRRGRNPRGGNNNQGQPPQGQGGQNNRRRRRGQGNQGP